MRPFLISFAVLTAACGVTDPQAECQAICSGCCKDGVCLATCDSAGGGQGGGDGGGTTNGGGTANGGGTSATGGGTTATGGGSNGGGSAGGTGGGMTVCTGETDAELCMIASQKCGPLSTTDRCNRSRTATCSACMNGEVCNASHACVCQPETNTALCTRLGKTCGTMTSPDNCGTSRTVSCGSCTGTFQTCGGGSTPNTCGCTAETDAAFCARGGRSCGSYSANDNCGHARTVAACGTGCTGGNTCSNGTCTCPDTNSAVCARNTATCGPLTATDTCGQSRNIASCGTCTGHNTCGGGGTANACGCTPETDAVLCANLGKNCGSVATTDGCGMPRTLACGTCSGTQICGTNNICACVAETNTAFCTRLGKNCGSVTAPDNCGTSRTASCGSATCSFPQTCGGAGTPNVCGCVSETDAQLCANAGRTCGSLSVYDSCSMLRAPACGTCGGSDVCGANGLVGQCSVPAVYDPSQTNGHAVSVAPTLLETDIHAMLAVSPTEVWLATNYNLLRVKPGSVTPYYPTGLATDAYLWASSPSDVWLATGQTLMRFNGTAWSPVTAGFAASNFTAMWGTATDDVFVATASELRHWDGSTWTAWNVPMGSASIRALAGNVRGSPFVATSAGIYKWNGLSYATLPTPNWHGSSNAQRALWVSPTGDLFAAGTSGCTSSYSYFDLQKYDGLTWTSLYDTYHYQSWCSTEGDLNISGTSSTNVWFGDGWGGSFAYSTMLLPPRVGHMVSTTATGVGFLATVRSLSEVTPSKTVPRFDPGSDSTCTSPSSDGAGTTWLLCSGLLGKVTVRDGLTTSAPTSVPATTLKALHTVPGGSLWLALSTGAIEKRASSGSTSFTQYLGSVFAGIHATSDTNVFAVTTEGGAARYDGTTWYPSMIPAGLNPRMAGIQTVSATSAWAWNATNLYEYAAGTWASVALPAGASGVTNLVSAGGGVWLLSNSSLYLRTGTTWTLQRAFATSVSLSGSSNGALTLNRTGTAFVVERWVSGSAVSTVSSVSALASNPYWVVTPTATEVLFGANSTIYRTLH